MLKALANPTKLEILNKLILDRFSSFAKAVKVAFGTNLAVVVPTAIIRAKMQYEGWKNKKSFPLTHGGV